MALVPGSLAGAWGYRRELRGNRRWLILLFAPSVLGGLAGALLLTRTDPGYFKLVIPWLLLLAALLFLAQPYLTRWFPPHPETGRPSLGVQTAVVVFQFFVAVYGGYFGAGIGILMLTSLSFMGIGDDPSIERRQDHSGRDDQQRVDRGLRRRRQDYLVLRRGDGRGFRRSAATTGPSSAGGCRAG